MLKTECLKLWCRFAPSFVKVVNAGRMGGQKSEQWNAGLPGHTSKNNMKPIDGEPQDNSPQNQGQYQLIAGKVLHGCALRVTGCGSFDWGLGIVDFGFVRFLPRDLQTFPYFNLPHSDFSQLCPLSSVFWHLTSVFCPLFLCIQSKGGVEHPYRKFLAVLNSGNIK